MEAWKADGESRSVEQLIEAASTLSSPQSLIDVDDPQLIAPGQMPERIATQLGNAWYFCETLFLARLRR